MKIGRVDLRTLNRPFLIAEAGSSHQGKSELALQAAGIAIGSGADALTFQELHEERLYADLPDFPVTPRNRVGWKCLEDCRRSAKEAGLCFSVCVTDLESLESALKIGIDFIKIVSYDITFLPFLEECGRTGLPILMSTGASLFDEVGRAVEALNASDRLVLYHTDCGYPTPDPEVNLRRMLRLKERFGLPVGYCDHTDHGLSCLAAAVFGAVVIEKHITVSRNLGGPDYRVSFEAPEITRLFNDIRRVSEMLGKGSDEIAASERSRRDTLRRSLALRRAVDKGETITEDLLTMLRPPRGLQWVDRHNVIGRRASRNLPSRHLVKPEDVE